MKLDDLIGRSLSVYWKDEDEWFDGVIEDVSSRGIHVQYFDGDEDWLTTVLEGVRIDNYNDDDINELENILSSGNFDILYGNDEGEEINVISDNSPLAKAYKEEDVPQSGFLVLGFINEVSNLSKEIEENESFFYRVLFVEESSQSSLLRCKTPIFSSSRCYDPSAPSWVDNQFSLEVSKQLKSSLPSGEISIAIYKSSPNSVGNYLVGQTEVNLSSIYEGGVSQIHSDSIMSKSSVSDYPLLSRDGNFLDLEPVLTLHLYLFWRNQNGKTSSVSGDCTTENLTSSIPMRNGISDSRPSSPSTKGASRTTTGKSVGRYETRKIVSASLRKRRADQMRIEKENQILLSKLQKHAGKGKDVTSKNAYQEALPIKAEAKGPNDKVSSGSKLQSKSQRVDSKSSDRNANALTPSSASNMRVNAASTHVNSSNNGVASSVKVNSRTSSGGSGESSKQSLIDTLFHLRQEIAEIDKECLTLKGNINRFRQQNRKFDSAVNRIEKSMNTGKTNGLPKESQVLMSEAESSLERKNMVLDLPDNEVASLLLKEYRLKAEAIKDKELLEIAEEHCALQKIRRSLTNRMLTVKEDTTAASLQTLELLEKKKTWMLRLRTLYPNYPRMTDNKTLSNYLTSSGDDDDKEKKIVCQLRQIQRDVDHIGHIFKEDVSGNELKSSIAELEEVLAYLENVKEGVVKDIDNLTYEKDMLQEKFGSSLDGDHLFRMREKLAFVQYLFYERKRKERVAPVTKGISDAEIAILQSKLYQTERQYRRENE